MRSEDRLTFFGRAFARFRGAGHTAFEWAMDSYESARDGIGEVRDDACDWIGEHATGIIITIAILLAAAMMVMYFHDLARGRLGEEAVKIAVGGLIAGTLMSLLAGAIVAPIIYLLLWKIIPWILFAIISAVLFVPIALGSALYGVLLAVLAVLEFLLMIPLVLLWIGQLGYLAYWHIFYTCPSGECSYRGQPLHVCPNCGQEYPKVWPSLYGHFYHICGSCGTRLPTLDWLGRRKLVRRCGGTRPDGSACRELLTAETGGRVPERLVAIVGGPSTGKTCYQTMLVRELTREEKGNPAPITAEIDNPQDREQWDREGPLLERGEAPPKTQEGVPQAFTLLIRFKRRHYRLYLYDAAGEEYDSIRAFGRHEQIKHIDGLILLSDPFALPGFTDRLEEEELPADASPAPLEEVADATINALNRMRGTTGGRRHHVPLAVVINKADTEPVKAELGDVAESPPDSKRCREALLEWGAGAAIRVLENNVANVRYFACSALGRDADEDDDRPFECHGVLEPLAWILARRGRR